MEKLRQKATLAAGAATTALLATPALAGAQETGVDYGTLTNGMKSDAQSGIEQALPIVGFVLAAIVVVALIRKFVKAH